MKNQVQLSEQANKIIQGFFISKNVEAPKPLDDDDIYCSNGVEHYQYCVHDLLSKPFCEAISAALYNNERWFRRPLEMFIDGWIYGDISELETNILNMITEAKK